MSLLKTFGVGNQQMMFSELLDHITKDAVDDLFDADPSEEALKKGAQLIVQMSTLSSRFSIRTRTLRSPLQRCARWCVA